MVQSRYRAPVFGSSKYVFGELIGLRGRHVQMRQGVYRPARSLRQSGVRLQRAIQRPIPWRMPALPQAHHPLATGSDSTLTTRIWYTWGGKRPLREPDPGPNPFGRRRSRSASIAGPNTLGSAHRTLQVEVKRSARTGVGQAISTETHIGSGTTIPEET